MNDSSSTSSKRRRAWYCYHLLAALSVLLLFVMLGAMLMLAGSESHAAAHEFVFSPRTADMLPRIAPIFAVCLVAALWLWVAMLRHYLQNRAVVSRGWLFWLIASNWGAAIGYFFLVWRRQHRHEST
jgi:cytochrome bd-type quinol oxidase subunit 2